MSKVGMKLKNFHLWLNRNYEGVRFWVALVVGIIVLITLLASIQENRRQNKTEVEEVKAVVREIRGGVDAVNENSKKQTIILCTIILRDGLALEEAEARSIEEICEQEVRRFDAAAAERTGTENTNPSSEEPQAPAQNNPPSSTENPQPNNPPEPPEEPEEPPEPPDPPQSILPIVDDPIVGCIGGFCI